MLDENDDHDDNSEALDTNEAAAFLTKLGLPTSASKMAKDRVAGGGAPYSRLGNGWGRSGRVRYTPKNLRKHAREMLAKRERRSTSQRPAA